MTLGEAPFRALTSTTSLFENERGTLHHYDDIPLIPTFHPNFLARNPSERSKTYEDLLKVKSLLSALTQ
jgi:DNA polymerase